MTRELLDLAQAHLYGNYRPAPFVLSHGKGCELFDTEGRRYLDMAAGVAVCAVGHGHPRHAAAISEQAARLGHVSNYFYNDVNIRLAVELCRRTGFSRAFFCNSGAEANEAMLKMARRHFYAEGQVERFQVLAFDNSFHGRTMGALALTGQAKYQQGFGPGVGGITHLPYNDLAAVEAAMTPSVAAIFVEPVQGEGGAIPARVEFLQGLRRLCDQHGALLMVDEIQTGIGRTGAFLAFEHAGIQPDAVALAKGLGGGFPIGSVLCSEKLAGALPPGTHGSTFGGNPLACAAALSVLEILDDERLIDHARRMGGHLGDRLRQAAEAHPTLFEGERGLGLLRGLVLRPGADARAALARVREQGVLLTAAGERTLRFTPPLIVTEAQLDEAVQRTVAALREA